MGQYTLLTPKQELAAAELITQAEVAYWRALLSHPPALAAIATTVEQHLDEAPPAELAALQSLAKSARGRALGKRKQAQWAQHADALAAQLRALDVSRDLVREVDRAVHALVGHGPQAPADDDAPFRYTAPWKRYLERVRAARAEQLQAKQAFASANLRLVVSIARRYSAQAGMPLADLIQEGNLGLLKAVERFDPERGFRFSTYASWWIRHAIRRARADKSRAVRLPVHMLETCSRVRQAESHLRVRNGTAPTTAELARETELSEAKVANARAQYTGAALSLDRPMGDGEGYTFLDALQDDAAVDPAEHAERRAWQERVPSLLEDLSSMEAEIIRHRFGLGGAPELTLRAIGERYELSRERIRQIQQQALLKLRGRLGSQPAVGDAS